ncbi:MAG TPA: transposase, partial [Candidatus Angelobacter sp.]
MLLVERLNRRTLCDAAEVAIAIEVAWGALVETLVESGFAVFSINPKQVDRFRDRFTVAGAKDDGRDALVLAGSLRTDRKSYRRVGVDTPEIIRLRELARFEEELKIELRRVTNRLWQQLHRYYPQVLKLSPAADERFVWDVLNAAPTPIEGSRPEDRQFISAGSAFQGLLAETEAWRKLAVETGDDAWVFPSEADDAAFEGNCWWRNMRPALKTVGLQWANF